MKTGILFFFLALFLLSAPGVARETGGDGRSYVVPGHGSLLLEIPGNWKEEIRQAGANLPPTIVLTKDGEFELLLTVIPRPEGKQPTLEDLEAGLRKVGARHLPSARQESLVLHSLEGEQATGRYFLLTEREPQPGEYPSVISGSLLTGTVVLSFTMLVQDPQAGYVNQGLRSLANARLRRGQGGKYAASLDDLRVKVALAGAAGIPVKVIEDKRKSYKVELGPVLLEAKTVKGGIDVWLDGSDYTDVGGLLKALTVGLEPLH